MNESKQKCVAWPGTALLLLLLALVSASALAQDQSQLKRGHLLYMQCRSCHDTAPAGAAAPGVLPKVGPNLHCLMGRAAASASDYGAYSEALAQSGIVWTPETLNQWLQQPSAMVPGTTMASFAGIASATDREALVAFLAKETACDP